MMLSPAWIPARSAGEPGSTRPTTGAISGSSARTSSARKESSAGRSTVTVRPSANESVTGPAGAISNALRTSSQSSTDRPPTAVSSAEGGNVASASVPAGRRASATAAMRAGGTCWTPQTAALKVNTRNAKSVFISTPAEITMTRAGSDLDSKSRGPRTGVSCTSPTSETGTVPSSRWILPPSICSISSMPAILT